MIKIGFDANRLLTDKRGVGRYVYELINQYSKISNEYHFRLFYNSIRGNLKKNMFNSSNARLKNYFFPVPTKFFKLCWNNLTFPKIEWFIGSIDLFHSPVFYLPPPSKAPLIVTIHDLAPIYFRKEISSSYLRYYKKGLKLVEKRADGIIAVSEHTLRDLSKFVSLKNKQYEIIPNGIGRQFRPIRDKDSIRRVKKKYGVKKDFFLYVGGAFANKNLYALLETYSKLPKSIQHHFDLVLAGKMDRDIIHLKQVIERSKTKGEIKFIGYVEESELPIFYSAAKLFIFPSLYEGFGMAPLEAMACGTPVLSSYRTSLKEVLNDAALEIDPDDSDDIRNKIISILNDNVKQQDLIQKGLAQSKKFSWENTAEMTLKFYKKIL